MALPPMSFSDAGMSTATVGPVTTGGLNMAKATTWKDYAALAAMGLAVWLILRKGK